MYSVRRFQKSWNFFLPLTLLHLFTWDISDRVWYGKHSAVVIRKVKLAALIRKYYLLSKNRAFFQHLSRPPIIFFSRKCVPDCFLLLFVYWELPSTLKVKTTRLPATLSTFVRCSTLCETYLYSELFWSAFSHIRTEYGAILKCGLE